MSDWSTLSKKELLELLESYDDEKHIVFKVNLKQGVVGFWDVKKDEINSDTDKLVLMSDALDKWYAEDIQELVEENNELQKRVEEVAIENDRKETIDKLNQFLIKMNVRLRNENKELKKKVDDLKFALRTELAHQRVEKKGEDFSDSCYDFEKKLDTW